MKAIRIIIGILLCLSIYLLPSGVAVIRERTNTASILVLNLFLGWLGIPWIIALMWAVANDDKKSSSGAT